MGTHNSKENHQLKSSANDNNNNNNTWQSSISSAKKNFIINKQTIYYGWQEIYRCSHNDWLHGISGEKKKKIIFSSNFNLTFRIIWFYSSYIYMYF